MPCVNEQTVHDLIVGRLEGQALQGVENHVAECSSCAALIALVARRTGSVDPHAGPAHPPPAAGVVHRDFKPHNVMIAKGGEVRVMDFGLAHLDTESDVPASGATTPTPASPDSGATGSDSSAEREARLTRTGTLLGTPAY